MLVLSRKIGEEIVIGDNIHVSIVDIRGDFVRFGVKAPLEIPILRGELVKENQNRFEEFLRNEQYNQALKMLRNNSYHYKPERGQVFRLERGLKKEGQLTDEITAYLGRFKSDVS